MCVSFMLYMLVSLSFLDLKPYKLMRVYNDKTVRMTPGPFM